MMKRKEMVKKVLTLLLALVLAFSDISPILTVFAEPNTSFADMEVGVRYSAKFNYGDAYLRNKDGQLYQYNGHETTVDITGITQPLIVVLENAGDIYVRISNEDWPAIYEEYRYVDEGEVTVLERLDPVEPDEPDEPEVPEGELIPGQVGLTVNGEEAETLAIAKGEKIYVFTDLTDKVEGTPDYCWQLLIDAENDRWATVTDYIYPYAVVSQALIANAGNHGVATLRCIVTAGDKQYVSGKLEITVDEAAPAPEPFVPITLEDAQTPVLADNSREAELVEAFHIVVNYTFRHASAADEDFDGSAAAGIHTVTRYTSYTGTVTSPRVVGYLPYVKVEDVDYVKADNPAAITYDGQTYYQADEIYFDAVDTMTTVDVYYIPQMVYYMVKYYEQNLHNDEYVLAGTQIKQGLAESVVGEGLDTERTGFTALYYDPNSKINGDGSAEIDIYYDRNYYLVQFDLGSDEAYGATPYYVRYNSQVMLPNPTRPGYAFTGWTLDRVYLVLEDSSISEVTSNQIKNLYNLKDAGKLITVQHNVDYTGGWKASTTSYTIAYWLEDPEYVDPADPSQVDPNEKYKIWGTKTVTGVTVGAVVDGPARNDVPTEWTTFRAKAKEEVNQTFEINELNYMEFISSDQDVVVKGDGSTVVNVYYDRKEYTLKFYYAKYLNNTWRVCARTNGFGNEASINDKTDEIKLLDAIAGDFYPVVSQPTLQSGVAEQKGYTMGYDQSGNNYYYYLSFKAKYGADISDQYPCDIFDPIQRSSGNNTSNGWSDNRAIMSAWTGEYNVLFSRAGGNQTMKGKFQIFNYVMLWHSDSMNIKDNQTVSYLCFWENAGSVGGWNVPELYRYKIWVPTLAGQSTTGLTTHTRNGVTYYLMDVYDTCDDSKVNEQTQPILKGFTANGEGSSVNIYANNNNTVSTTGAPVSSAELSEIRSAAMKNLYKEAYIVDYFYSRNSATLGFNNSYAYNEVLTIPYQQSLAQYKTKVPYYPSSVEQGAIIFAGDRDEDGVGDGAQWYLDTGFSLPFSFDVLMDVSNIQLYAKWDDCYYTANVYLDGEMDTPLGAAQTVKFGSQILEPDYKAAQAANPTYEKLIFAGWYYVEDGEEKRFDFNTMLLKQDLDIYAKWTSKVPVPYTVYYVTEKAGGPLVIDGVNYVEIAERTEGVSLAGISKSFTAKVGSELYTEYRTAHFPQNRSHSIKMSNTQPNEYAFVYAAPNRIQYSVVHTFVNDEFISILGTNTIVLTVEHDESAKDKASVITVSFRDQVTKANVVQATGKTLSSTQQDDLWKIIVEMSPNVYEQDLILTMNSEENVANFDWLDRDLVSVYQVVHKFQSVDGTTYVAELPMEFSGNIGDTATAKAVERYGFKCTDADGQVSGTIKKIEYKNGSWTEGLILELKYDRIEYNYTVHYRSGMETLAASKTFKARFGTVVKLADRAVTVNGYTLTNGDATVEISKEGQELICYYQGLDVYYRYQVGGRVLGGMLEPDTHDAIVGERPDPSKLTVLPGYLLKRWYYMVSGDLTEYAVPDTWLSADKLTVKPTAAPAEWAGKTITIFAEVMPTVLTVQSIIAAGQANAWVTEDQGFIYHISGKAGTDTAGITLTVAVPEGKEVTVHGLPNGQYTVTLESEWSWRYANASKTVTLQGEEIVTFSYDFPGGDKPGGKYYITDEAQWLD